MEIFNFHTPPESLFSLFLGLSPSFVFRQCFKLGDFLLSSKFLGRIIVETKRKWSIVTFWLLYLGQITNGISLEVKTYQGKTHIKNGVRFYQG
jgi:hypothetical protein